MFAWETSLKLAFAGLWPLVWHWGVLVGIAILCLAAAFFSSAIPVIGPWLGTVRRDLEWIAAAALFGLACLIYGAHDEARHCTAKAIVIEKTVDKAVSNAQAPSGTRDPFDSPEN